MHHLVTKVTLLSALLTLGLSIPAQAAQPQMVSLSPSSGSGQSQTFTLTASDTAGASDIAGISMLINSVFDGSSGCWMYFDHVHRQFSVNNNGQWSGPSAVGGTLGNTRCTVQLVSATDSGNNASVSFAITFDASWLGAKTIWGAAADLAGSDSGYQQMGTFTAASNGPAPDFTVAMTPASQTTTPGNSVTYQVTVTSVNGFTGFVYFNGITASPQLSGVTFQESSDHIEVPANGSNSGTITVLTSSGTPPTNSVTITANFTDNNLQHSAQANLSIVSSSAPVSSVSPNSGSGSTQTFTITTTDPGGWAAVSGVDFLMNSSLDGRHGCWLFYAPQPGLSAPGGTISLSNDDTTNWTTSEISSSSNTVTPIQNSQCSVFGGPSTVNGSGDTLTLTITLTFTTAFAGPKSMYVDAADSAGPSSGYQQAGTWTAAAGSGSPDFSVTASPSSQNVTGQGLTTYAVNVTGIDGYSGTVNLSVSGLPPNSTLTPPTNIGPGQSTTFTVNTTGSTPSGAYTLTITGTDGTRTHTATVVLNVTAASIPTLSASPNSGSGNPQAFTFTASGQGGATDPSGINVLFNTSVDGSHACWMYFNGFNNRLMLASDDGSAWAGAGSDGTVQNSQCTLSSIQNASSGDTLGFSVVVTFSGAFTGSKNIYMYSVNGQGGETGYQLKGTWTP